MRKKTKGVSAVIATILMLMITIAMAGLAYGFISGAFTQKTGVVIEIDETGTSCAITTISVRVRNTGTMQTTTDKVTLSGTNSQGSDLTGAGDCDTTLAAQDLDAGAGSKTCGTTLGGTAGTNTVVASGPSNTVSGTVYCPG